MPRIAGNLLLAGLTVAYGMCQMSAFAQSALPSNSAIAKPYTAHLIITEERVLPDGSSRRAVSTEVLARDLHGRKYEMTGHAFRNGFSFLVQDPIKQVTLTWDSETGTAIKGHWPYWSGREGCWADERGRNQWRMPEKEEWHKVPASPSDGKLEELVPMAVPSGDQRIQTRVVTENLGRKEIHGLTASGMRMIVTPLKNGGAPETTTEMWRSEEFDFNLLKVTSGPKYGLKRIELSEFQRGDPDLGLFEPPHGYAVEIIEYHQVPCAQQ
jgi:hypothetical protein